MLICNRCLTPQKSGSSIKERDDCPIKDCGGKIIEIDEIFLTPLLLIMTKGYHVDRYSSPYRLNDNILDGYIGFGYQVFPEMLPPLPPQFYYEEMSDRAMISFEKQEGSLLERQKKTFETSNALLKWASELPTMRNYFIVLSLGKKGNVKPLATRIERQFPHACVDILNKPDNTFQIFVSLLDLESSQEHIKGVIQNLAKEHNTDDMIFDSDASYYKYPWTNINRELQSVDI